MMPWSLLVLTSFAWSQTPDSYATFEVASIRPLDGNTFGAGIDISGTAVTASGPISHLISLAFNVRGYQIRGIPSKEPLYIIKAKTAGNSQPSREEARVMLRNLLESRFNLRVHKESQPVNVYLLEISPRGIKVKRSDAGFDMTYRPGPISSISATVSMQTLSNQLAQLAVDRPVLDRTGLTGLYEIKLQWSPSNTGAQEAVAGSIFTAIEEDLGLKLVAAKEPTDVVVIDQVGVPSEN
jgi:uncharacterized protein (TIGR03435 family)